MNTDDIAKLPKKIEKRSDYLRGTGFVVKVQTTYTRERKVRALNAEDAQNYALAREGEFAPRYFRAQGHRHFSIDDISVVSVEPAETNDDE